MMNVECMNTVENIYVDGGSTILDINEIPYFENFQYDLMDEKSFKKYITDLERVVRNSFEYRQLIRYLKYSEGKKERVITGLKRISKSGLRVYAKHDELPRVLNGLGIAIISTSNGIMTDRDARKQKLGGEVLAYIW